MLSHWLLLPLIAAAIGWFTNFVAVRMIFRPHRPVKLLGLTLQGLLPKRKKEFAHNIGATVSEHLISAEDIRNVLQHPKVHERTEEVVRGRIDAFFAEKLVATVPMLGAFLQGPMVDKIKDKLVEEVHGMLAEEATVLGDSLEDALDLHRIVEDRILAFDLFQLEQVVLRVAHRELRWIEVLGAILGFLVGLLQVALLRAMES